MTSSRPIRVGAFGLDDRARNLLRLFFAGPCKGRFALAEDADAEIQLVDLDRPGGWDYYKEQEATDPKAPLVGISVHAEREAEVPLFIKKPMRLDAVLSVLKRVGDEIRPHVDAPPAEPASKPQSPKAQPRPTSGASAPRAKKSVPRDENARSFAEQRHTGTATTADGFEQGRFNQFLHRVPDANLARSEATEKLFYDPEEWLQSYVQSAVRMARERNTTVRIGGFWGALYIVPEENRAYSGLLDGRLRGLTVMRMEKKDVMIEPIDTTESKNRIAELGTTTVASSIDALMWKLALWTSRGRLPNGTDLQAPVFLRRWPNFTRFVETPGAMRIASLWARQPSSLEETSEALGVRQAETFAFYCAAATVGCIGLSHRQADTLISPVPVQPAAERKLLKRMLNRLFG